MAVLRQQKRASYTIVDNDVFRDRSLSFKAVGLFCQLTSLPDGWVFSTRGLTALHRDGEASTTSALRELEAAGYIGRGRIRDAEGMLRDTVYLVCSKRTDPSAIRAELLSMGAVPVADIPTSRAKRQNKKCHGDFDSPVTPDELPDPENPDLENDEGFPPDPGNPDQENQDLDSKYVGINNELDPPSSSLPQASDKCNAKAVESENAMTPEQKEAYLALCRASLKPVRAQTAALAEAAYRSRLSEGITPEEIAAAYKRYVRRYTEQNPTTTRFAKQLADWLEQADGLAWDRRAVRGHASEDGPPALTESEWAAIRRAKSSDLDDAFAAVDPAFASLRGLVARRDIPTEELDAAEVRLIEYRNEHRAEFYRSYLESRTLNLESSSTERTSRCITS